MLVKQGGNTRLYVKGAVEQILSRTRYYMTAGILSSSLLNRIPYYHDFYLHTSEGREEALDNDTRTKMLGHIDTMTKTGLRCIGLAYQV